MSLLILTALDFYHVLAPGVNEFRNYLLICRTLSLNQYKGHERIYESLLGYKFKFTP